MSVFSRYDQPVVARVASKSGVKRAAAKQPTRMASRET
jgi:hypothetical protein